MGKIIGEDITVKVKVINSNAYVMLKDGDDRIVVDLDVENCEHDTATVRLWFDPLPNLNKTDSKPGIEEDLDKLELLGMKDRDIRNLDMVHGSCCEIYVVKKGSHYRYYLNVSSTKKIDLNTAATLIETLRGKAKLMTGTPISDSDNLNMDIKTDDKW